MREPYDREFYSGNARRSSSSARVVVPRILSLAPASSVLDVGCGSGAWLSAFAENGIDDYRGVDLYVEPDQLLIPPDHFERVDLSKPFDLGRTYDIVVSLEVAEHLPASSAAQFVQSLARHGDLVVFSAAAPGQTGPGHVNEQWPSYWRSIFRDRGFELFDLLRGRIWDEPDVRYWFRQNVLLYARGAPAEALAEQDVVSPLNIVHPAMFARQSNLSLRQIVEAFPGALRRSVRTRVGQSRPSH